ncbi:hypothetical protein I4U23_000640 [Adineta vaga]|nr:hypothetical protein I4U23_000640 [Adineta vaga]
MTTIQSMLLLRYLMSEILKINSIEKVTDVTTRITCPLNAYACRDVQINENSLQQHYLSEQHQKSLGEHAQHINENENDDSTDTNIDMIEGNESSSTKAYEKLLLLTENVEKNQEDLTRLNENLIRSKNQVSSLSRQSDNILNTSALEASSIDAISINENILKQELADLKQRVENGNVKRRE